MFFFVLSLCRGYINECNSSTVLEPGYVCCNDEVCHGMCIRPWLKTYSHKCVSEFEGKTCSNQKYRGILIGILASPTVIFFILSFCINKKRSYVSFMADIILNVFYGSTIYSWFCYSVLDYEPILVVFVYILSVVYLFSRFNICNCMYKVIPDNSGPKYEAKYNATKDECSCCKQSNPGARPKCCRSWACCADDVDVLAVSREIRLNFVPMEDLSEIAKENSMTSPEVNVIGMQFFRNLEQIEKHPISYGTWQDESSVDQLVQKKVVVYHCDVNYEMDEELKEVVEREKERAVMMPEEPYVYHAEYCDFTVPGLTTDIVASDSNCAKCCWSSCLVKYVLYEILFFLGYHSIFEVLWRSQVSYVNQKSLKRIAKEGKLRAAPGERDSQTALGLEIGIRSNGIEACLLNEN